MNDMNYYTYYSYEEFGRGYIGSRKSKVPPEQDTRYMGSFTDKTFKPTQKIILASHYKTREEALDDEILLQHFFKVVPNQHFANRAYQTSNKFTIEGDIATQIGKKKWAKYTKQERSEMVKKCWATMSVEERSERTRKGNASRTPEQRSEIARKREATKTPEQRSEIARKGQASKTPEQRKESMRKAYSQKFQCTVTGFITNAGSLSTYQRARGIDTSKKVRIDQ